MKIVIIIIAAVIIYGLIISSTDKKKSENNNAGNSGNVLKFVEGEIKAGKTKDEILKATLIPGGEEWKTDGIQRPLAAAWEELTEK